VLILCLSGLELESTHQLRKHFATRSSEILLPLNRYFTSLIPTSYATISSRPASIASEIRPSPEFSASLGSFVPSAFFTSLKTHGSPLPFRSQAKQKDFYERWLRSPAFGFWLAQREQETRAALAERHS
jgi:hypothetical protein